MESITKSILTGKSSRRSKWSIVPNDLDSIRAMVLGKFYEGIVARWLVEIEKYTFLEGKPSVYWCDLKISNAAKFKEYRTSLKRIKKENKTRTNSDGLLEKNGKCYLWEAKNWPKWNQGLTDDKKQILNIFKTRPWIFAKKVKHKGYDKPIEGIIFSWWNEFDNYSDFEKETSKLIGADFKIYFTSNIIDDCRANQYKWYLRLIGEQRRNISGFLQQLTTNK